MIRINLQTAGQRKKQRRATVAATTGSSRGGPSSLAPALMLILPIAGGVGGSYYVQATLLGQIEETTQEIRTAEAELARLKPILDELEQFKRDKALLEQKLAAIRALERARTGPVKLYAELASLIPREVWVTSIRENGGNAAIDGLGLDSQSVAIFVNSMLRSPYFSSVELTSVEATQYLGLNIKKFSVTCRFETPAAAQATPAAAKAAAAR